MSSACHILKEVNSDLYSSLPLAIESNHNNVMFARHYGDNVIKVSLDSFRHYTRIGMNHMHMTDRADMLTDMSVFMKRSRGKVKTVIPLDFQGVAEVQIKETLNTEMV